MAQALPAPVADPGSLASAAQRREAAESKQDGSFDFDSLLDPSVLPPLNPILRRAPDHGGF